MNKKDYSTAKIYKIVSDQTEKVYIGSTTKKYLKQRLSGHKADYKRWQNGKKDNITSFEIIKYDDCHIVLIENFPCNDINELRSRERYWIENTENCVNKHIPGRTKQEYKKKYREENKEKIQQLNKQYREQNKEKINKECECECGSKYIFRNKTRHFKSKKHQEFITKNQENENLKNIVYINNNADLSTTILQ